MANFYFVANPVGERVEAYLLYPRRLQLLRLATRSTHGLNSNFFARLPMPAEFDGYNFVGATFDVQFDSETNVVDIVFSFQGGAGGEVMCWLARQARLAYTQSAYSFHYIGVAEAVSDYDAAIVEHDLGDLHRDGLVHPEATPGELRAHAGTPPVRPSETTPIQSRESERPFDRP